jgi:hypothetical protein
MKLFHIDKIEPPPMLDGEFGLFKFPVEKCLINAKCDLVAIRLWLGLHQKNHSTYRAYRTTLEQLVNWAYFFCKKPISSLDKNDFEAFSQFLIEPECPRQWLCQKSTRRDSKKWTPAFAQASLETVFNREAIIKSLFDWLRKVGYCSNEQFYLYYFSRGRDCSIVERVKQKKRSAVRRMITLDEWRLVKRSFVDAGGDGKDNIRQLVLGLIYYCEMSLQEIVDIETASLALYTEGDLRCWTLLRAHSYKGGFEVYAPPPLALLVEARLNTLYLGGYRDLGFLSQHKYNSNLIAESQKFLGCGVDTLRTRFNEALMRAANVASQAGLQISAERLMTLTPHDLKMAFEQHATSMGLAHYKQCLSFTKNRASEVFHATSRSGPRYADELKLAFKYLSPIWDD